MNERSEGRFAKREAIYIPRLQKLKWCKKKHNKSIKNVIKKLGLPKFQIFG